MIHVYAVTDPRPQPPPVAGVGGAELGVVIVRELAVVISRHDGAPPAPSPETALAHAAVCDRLLDDGAAVLPVRYGARYASVDALRSGIEERHDGLGAALGRVRGRVEIALRVLWQVDEQPAASAPDAGASPGRAYLLQRVAEEQQRRESRQVAERRAAALHTPLAAAAEAAQMQVLATPRLLLTAAYLVPRTEVDDFRERVDELVSAYPDLRLLCTGPWPAYSFADIAAPGVRE